jgi:hypothetical protein
VNGFFEGGCLGDGFPADGYPADGRPRGGAPGEPVPLAPVLRMRVPPPDSGPWSRSGNQSVGTRPRRPGNEASAGHAPATDEIPADPGHGQEAARPDAAPVSQDALGGLHARPADAFGFIGGAAAGLDDPYLPEGRFPDQDYVWLADRILDVADSQAAEITQEAWSQASAIRVAAEREAAAIRQQAVDQAAAIRDAAEREAAAMRAAILAMSGELGRAAAHIIDNPNLPAGMLAAIPAETAGIPAGAAGTPGGAAGVPAKPPAEPGTHYEPAVKTPLAPDPATATESTG